MAHYTPSRYATASNHNIYYLLSMVVRFLHGIGNETQLRVVFLVSLFTVLLFAVVWPNISQANYEGHLYL